MRRVFTGIVLLLVIFIFLVGCVDYKAYDAEPSLVDEIAAIENQLENEEKNLAKVKEEVVLPELTEEEQMPEDDVTLQTIRVKENELVKLMVTVTDPDEDPVTYTFSQPVNEQGEWKTNYGDAGEYVITIIATDGQLSTEKRVKIAVERVNVAPVLTGVKDLIVDEGELVSFTPQVTDPNGDVVTTRVSEPLKDGTFDTDHTSAGEYRIEVLATDGELDTTEIFTLTVNDVNVLPEVTNVENVRVQEGETVRIEPRITDLDEDAITVTISDPVGNDGVWETKFTDHGEYPITVTVDDGKDKVIRRITVTVEDVNMAPEITNVNLVS
jgi:large repetitive protein